MKVDEKELAKLAALSDRDLLIDIGGKVLGEGFGAGEASEDEKAEEGQHVVAELTPVAPGVCGNTLVRAFITGTNTELSVDLIAVVGDMTYHAVLPVPALTLTVAFIRFGLRKYCAQHG